MHFLNPLTEDYSKLSDIYQRIFDKNAVALLGAGASVSNNQFLSKEFIKLYEGKISKSFGTEDIVKFVDILQLTPNLRRGDFDKFVVDQLSKLRPNEGHSIFVTIPWKEVITTNFDTLIEEASENALRENKTHFHLHTIKNKKQLDYQPSNNEIIFIKLHGCKTDLSTYPLVFSTEDFSKVAPFYKKVLSPFKTYSNDIVFLAFGYSFADQFSEKLLDNILSTDFRQKRLIYCVDPYVNEDRLPYYESKNIATIKMSFVDFFINYQRWFESANKNYLKTLQKFTNPNNTAIKIDTPSRIYLDTSLTQLKDDYRATEKIRKYDFYFGAEPNYQVVVDDFDVVKRVELNRLITVINESFNEHSRTSIPKLILINGDFGTGKTTFSLRAIKEYLKQNNNTLAFEITRSIGIKKGYIAQIIKESTATRFIFYCDNIETDSVFKSFNELRVDLATEQYSDISIVFISSIRENILEKYKNLNKFSIANNTEFHYDSIYSKTELQELIQNLKEVGLLSYRDLTERDSIVYNVKHNYKGHSFISLYSLIQNGTHYKLLQKAYDELTADIKAAFKITALIHRFNMECPASVIVNSIRNLDWKDFEERVVRGDGKNILFQVKKSLMNCEPDLYFKTRHPVIAEALIKLILSNQEKNALYKNIFSALTYSDYNATFIVDLIKNIRHNDTDITAGQIDNYYSICKKEFESSPHFLISYITNIEKKTSSVSTLLECIRDIELLESSLDYRNNRLIHRKGSLNYKIARLLFAEKSAVSEVKYYLSIAQDWFEIKKQMDPSSNYSYLDYLNMLIWKFKNLKLEDAERIELNLTINNLFDEAFKTLYEDTTALMDIFEEYNELTSHVHDNGEYLEFLLDRYYDVETRPQAAMLMYYFYDYRKEYDKCDDLIEEIKTYTDIKDVVYFLFKHYGRNLHNPYNRIKYFELIRYNEFLKDLSEMRYYYFTSVSEFYDYRWREGKKLLAELKSLRHSNFNPDFFLYWKNETGQDQVFEAEIILDNKIKKVKITTPFFKDFVLVGGNYKNYSEGDLVDVKLRFVFEGVQAEIVK